MKNDGQGELNLSEPEVLAGKLLREKGLTIGTVESATGGLLAARIIGVPGASDYCRGGIIAYHNEVKMSLAGVKYATLLAFGAVSARVAEEMAAGGRQRLGVDICISDTGIAGPGGGNDNKPAGLFYLGLATAEGVRHRKYIFKGSRQQNRTAAVNAALEWLLEELA
ncbi:CinA family protein [Candidatus Dehalogenimonas loeffleri]|uniref:CinA family protein n=1 Tax=Candidatus Dehalogenimonas loeffleri TaxID=3127115 RepID=A0ABZ2J1P2_9CHLR